MTIQELNECMNVYITLWRSSIEGDRHRDNMLMVWKERGLLELDKDLLVKAFYEYEDKTEKNYIAPRVAQIKQYYKNVSKRETKQTGLRIETPEEVAARYFHEEMQKPMKDRNDYLLQNTKHCAAMFQDESLYIKHFGKPRDEFERL